MVVSLIDNTHFFSIIFPFDWNVIQTPKVSPAFVCLSQLTRLSVYSMHLFPCRHFCSRYLNKVTGNTVKKINEASQTNSIHAQ